MTRASAGNQSSAVEQHDRAGDAEADRQDHQREADAEVPLDFARQPHLDDEADHRRVELYRAEEARDRIGVALRPSTGCGRHVELLLDDGGADGGKPDDQRDRLQVLAVLQQPQRLGAADAFVLAAGQRSLNPGFSRAMIGTTSPRHSGHHRRADQQQVGRADRRRLKRERRAGDAAEAGAAADEPEDALRLPRVVDCRWPASRTG